MTLIEIVHSTYGVVKLRAELDKNGSMLFFRLDEAGGGIVGEMDDTSGGWMCHPNLAVDTFLSVHGIDLIIVDERGYIELEDSLYEEVNRLFPDFFCEEA